MKEEIIKLLNKEFGYIYCHNCASSGLDEDNEEYYCDDCCRKSMGWSISDITAERLASSILEVLK